LAGKSPSQEGHTIGRPGGPDLLMEEPVGTLPKNKEVVPILHGDDTTEAATRLTRSGRSVRRSLGEGGKRGH